MLIVLWQRRKKEVAAVLLAVTVCATMALSVSTVAVRLSKPVARVSATDLYNQNSVMILDFAVSPDNGTIAIAFAVPRDKEKVVVWLGEWKIVPGKLLAKIEVSDSVPLELAFIGLRHRTIQYTPDGSALILQAGYSLNVFEASDLKLRFAVRSDKITGTAVSAAVGQMFAISQDGKKLAVLSGQMEYPGNRLGVVSFYDVGSGKELSNWPALAHIASLSLSRNGDQLLATVFEQSDAGDILLLDGLSGHVVRSFVSGFQRASSQKAASDALFIDATHFVASPAGWIDRNGNYPGSSLKVFDSRTGDVTGELTYDKFGPSGSIWVSNEDSIIATLSVWMPHWKRRFNLSESGPKQGTFLFFRPRSGVPYCIVGPLPKTGGRASQSGFIRLSPDLQFVGLFVNDMITVYSIGDCTVPR
ncbi:MAG TPA: hypothetical protein VFO39_18660 [Candidatus Sulfotelmatobacter sp.]|nr:hypothetical protein [Candidatus Sulfotelmatobacter sp.]